MPKITLLKRVLFSLIIFYPLSSYAVDSGSMPVPTVTPATNKGYILGQGFVQMPTGNCRAHALYAYTGGKLCQPGTTAMVTLTPAYVRAWKGSTNDIVIYPIGPGGWGATYCDDFQLVNSVPSTTSIAGQTYYYIVYQIWAGSDSSGANISFQWTITCVPNEGANNAGMYLSGP